MKRKIKKLNGKITFVNDDSKAPSPDLPVSDALASMIESAVSSTGLSININSTTGGAHSKRSFHYHGMAVDINRINGKRIDDKSNAADVLKFQQFLEKHSDIGECFGPSINIRKQGTNIVQKPQMKKKHLDHLHISSQR